MIYQLKIFDSSLNTPKCVPGNSLNKQHSKPVLLFYKLLLQRWEPCRTMANVSCVLLLSQAEMAVRCLSGPTRLKHCGNNIVIPLGVPLFFKDLGLQTYATLLNNKSQTIFVWIDYKSIFSILVRHLITKYRTFTSKCLTFGARCPLQSS